MCNPPSMNRDCRNGEFSRVIVRVGYEWRKTEDGASIHPRSDERWCDIRKFLCECADEATKRLANRDYVTGEQRVAEVARLRATAGRPVTERILEYIRDADILLFDLSPGPTDSSCKANPNVCVELGMALGMQKNVFIIAQHRCSVPSDVQGFYVTEYNEKGDGNLALNKDQSLRSALVGAVIRAFCQKNSLEYIEEEDESP